MNAPRFERPEPGPMLLPVPAVVLGVKGDEETPDDLTVVEYIPLGHPAKESTPPPRKELKEFVSYDKFGNR